MSLSRPYRFSIDQADLYPCLGDATAATDFDPHYIYHTGWAARKLAERPPDLHIDFSSLLYFASIVSAFVPLRVYDFRPANLHIDNVRSSAADLTRLPFPDRCFSSVSCMHVVEHIGLGRYGDPLDPDGDLCAIRELIRIIADGGRLLFVVPISGRARVAFNAHRIYTCSQILGYFNELALEEFALIPDNALSVGLIRHADPALADRQQYGCGCFCFQRKTS
jgi:SAM-dependent methyltransferase